MLCRKSASELTQIKPVLDQLGVKLVAIGSGTPAMAKNFVEEFKFAGEIYTDESRKIYNDFQCKRGWSKAMFNKKTLKFIKTAFTEGYAQGKTQGDLTQLGGTFVLDGMRVVFEYLEKYAGDHVSPGLLLEYLGATDEMYASLKLITPKAKKKLTKLDDKINKLQSVIKLMSTDANANVADSLTEEESARQTEKEAKMSTYKKTKLDRYKKRLAQYLQQRDEVTKKSQSAVLGLNNNNNNK
jgi:hypothetical protein